MNSIKGFYIFVAIRVRTLNIIPLVQAGYSEPQLWGGGGQTRQFNLEGVDRHSSHGGCMLIKWNSPIRSVMQKAKSEKRKLNLS